MIEDLETWRRNLGSYLDRRIEELKYLLGGARGEDATELRASIATLDAIRQTFFTGETLTFEQIVEEIRRALITGSTELTSKVYEEATGRPIRNIGRGKWVRGK